MQSRMCEEVAADNLWVIRAYLRGLGGSFLADDKSVGS